MRRNNILLFDDSVVGTTTVNTDAKFNDMLAQFDELAIFAVADQVSGTTPTLTVQIFHSGDQRNWLAKNSTGAEINAVALSSGSTGVFFGSDAGSTPTAGYARLNITLGGTSPVAHVKIWACQRDQA